MLLVTTLGLIGAEDSILLEPVLNLSGDGLTIGGGLLALNLNSLLLVGGELAGEVGIGGVGKRRSGGRRPLLDLALGIGKRLGLRLVVAESVQVDLLDGIGCTAELELRIEEDAR